MAQVGDGMKRWLFVGAALWMAVTPWPIAKPHLLTIGDWFWLNGGEGMDFGNQADFAFHAVWVLAMFVGLAWPWLDRAAPTPSAE